MDVVLLGLFVATTLQVQANPDDETEDWYQRGPPRLFRTASRRQFPWMSGIWMDDSAFCGGVLVAPRWVLTTAQCIRGFDSFQVTLGAITITEMFQQQQTSDVVTVETRSGVFHEDYNSDTRANDIGLLYLASDSPRVTDNTIGLPEPVSSYSNLDNRVGQLTTWGRTPGINGPLSDPLSYHDVRIITNQACSEFFPEMVTTDTLCATSVPYDTCYGNSGSPLILNQSDVTTLVGLISFGGPDCYTLPLGFSRVTGHLDWIADHINSTTGSPSEPTRE